jgi:hypothetical protein
MTHMNSDEPQPSIPPLGEKVDPGPVVSSGGEYTMTPGFSFLTEAVEPPEIYPTQLNQGNGEQ